MEVQREQKQNTEAERRLDWSRMCRELRIITPVDIKRIEYEAQKREEESRAEFEKRLKEELRTSFKLVMSFLGTFLCVWAGLEIVAIILLALNYFLSMWFIIGIIKFFDDFSEWL